MIAPPPPPAVGSSGDNAPAAGDLQRRARELHQKMSEKLNAAVASAESPPQQGSGAKPPRTSGGGTKLPPKKTKVCVVSFVLNFESFVDLTWFACAQSLPSA